jgi:uncharacterized protein YigE (DUF2233 family)
MAQSGRHLFLLCLCAVATACALSPTTSTPSPAPSLTPAILTAVPTATVQPTVTRVPTRTPTPEPDDTGWRPLAPGVEWRHLWADTGAGNERLHLIRLEPDQIRMRVVYQPSHPRKISQWAQVLPNALIVVNAGYFTPDYRATGLVISDGIASGRSHGDYAGMLAAGPDGQITLRWLRTAPYRPGETLFQAVQSFPVLVKPGGQMGFPADADEGQRSRRTVVAQDATGRIILIIGPEFRFSLHELAVWLAESDLDIDIALNLDGGTSSGLWGMGYDSVVNSNIPVPAVIAFEPAD